MKPLPCQEMWLQPIRTTMEGWVNSEGKKSGNGVTRTGEDLPEVGRWGNSYTNEKDPRGEDTGSGLNDHETTGGLPNGENGELTTGRGK